MRRELPGAYRPGTSLLHRLGPGAKLLGLFALGVVIIAVRHWAVGAASLVIGLTLVLGARVPAAELWRLLRAFAIVGVPLFAFQTWQQGWLSAFTIVAGVLGLILASTAVTASTSPDDMLDTLVWALGPLRPLGVSPERVALAVQLAIRSLPFTFQLANETRDAARSRGLDRNPRALLVPFAVRTVAHAQLTGEALAARGIGDDEPNAKGQRG